MPSIFGDRLREFLAGDNPLRSVVASRPAWRDLSVHLRQMDQSDVEKAIVLPYATELLRGLKSLGGALNDNMEAYNRSMSEDLSRTHGRFYGAAVVDPFGGKESIRQLDRSLTLPSMVAIGLNASYEGISLDDPAFEPIYHVARHHDVPVLVHPSSVAQSWADTLRLDNIFLRTGLGF
ncbi:MAG: amidohydrolase family protein, partial [Deltaproteobacteria bacterium]|nr:amidohydrolase family protein [Deltaproteobacteria bacterium]